MIVNIIKANFSAEHAAVLARSCPVHGGRHKEAGGQRFLDFFLILPPRGCMHRWVFIKKTWLSAFSYAQSCISLVFCCSLGFLVPWFSPLQLNKIWRIFCVMYGEEGGWTLIVCLKNYISLTSLNGFFAIFNFDNIYIKSNIYIWSLFSMQTTPRKPSSCLDFRNQGKKSAKTRTLGFLGNNCA